MASARDKILTAAQACFGRVGVQHSHVQMITETAGVARSSFYRHFRDLDDILLTLAVKQWKAHLRTLAVATADISDARERWCVYVAGMATIGTTQSEQDALFDEATILHVVRLFYREPKAAVNELIELIVPLIEASKADATLRTDVESSILAEWLLRQAWALSSIPAFQGWQPQTLQQYVSTFVLPSLLAPATPEASDSDLRQEIQRLSSVVSQLDQRLQQLLS